jgi:hypothetical protein
MMGLMVRATAVSKKDTMKVTMVLAMSMVLRIGAILDPGLTTTIGSSGIGILILSEGLGATTIITIDTNVGLMSMSNPTQMPLPRTRRVYHSGYYATDLHFLRGDCWGWGSDVCSCIEKDR